MSLCAGQEATGEGFCLDRYLCRETFEQVVRLRLTSPGCIEQELRRRRRRALWQGRKLVMVAADHNARMLTGWDGDPLAVGWRRAYLGRLTAVLLSGAVDGVEATADVLEELAAVNLLMRERGGPDLLADKVLVGTVNRGGLAGTVFEMRDRPTAYTVTRARDLGLDGVKMMFRLDAADPGSGHTIAECAATVSAAAEAGLWVFLECLAVEREDGKYRLRAHPVSVVQVVNVAAGLGSTSLRTWLEIPVLDEVATVVESTTLPLLVFSRERYRHPAEVLSEYARCCLPGPNPAGVLLGRDVVMNRVDPGVLARAVARVWKDGVAPADALAGLESGGNG